MWKKREKLILQLILWILFLGISIGFSTTFMETEPALIATGISISAYAIVFYSNNLFFYPRFFKSGKMLRYYILILAFMIGMVTLQVHIEEYFMHIYDEMPKHIKHPKWMMASRSFFWYLLLVMISDSYLIQNQLRENLAINKAIKEEQLQTELKLLKSQINPHFLFNALNNIFSLSYMKSDKAPDSILKLSGMLRYVIEDCSQEMVSLHSEIDYINNYIAFQKMKSQEEQNVKFEYSDVDGSIALSPLLFIPFIENSFKYSKVEEFSGAFVNIRLSTDKEKNVEFEITNSIPENGKPSSGTGTGIKNVKHRLDILYTDRHELNIDEAEDRFIVNLKIKQS
jgi:sensor histidine kinase YesM